MPDTTTRPTPEQIAEALEDEHDGGFTSSPTLDEFIYRLAEHGYVIVHPDDVPKHDTPTVARDARDSRRMGWNDCRAHIFGDTDA